MDVLDLAVLVEAHLSVLPPDPRLFVAAERIPRIDHVVVVDPHGSRPDLLGNLDGPAIVARPHAAGQSVDRVVGHGYGVGLVIERDDHEHWPEDLLLGHAHAALHVAQDRGPVVEAALVTLHDGAFPARQDVRPLVPADPHVALDGLELRLRYDRPLVAGRIEGGTD